MRDSYQRNQYLRYTRTLTSPTGEVWEVREFSGSHLKSKGFRGDLIPSDGVRPTPYYATRGDRVAKPFKIVDEKWYGTYTYEGYFWLPVSNYGFLDGVTWDYRFPNRITNRAIATCMGNVRANNLDLGQFLGELPETWTLIVEQSLVVLRALNAVRKGDYAKAGKILGQAVPKNPRDAASAWLSYKFGWLPLLQDIHSMAQFDPIEPGYATAVGVATENHIMTGFSSLYVPKGSPKHTKGAECKVAYTVEDSVLANLTSLGLANPLSIAWELAPLSFVVDWFLPIGNSISALTQNLGLVFDHGYITRFAHGTFTVQSTTFGTNGIMPSWEIDTSGMDRQVLSTFPMPKVAIPPLLDPNKGATMLALLAQRS